MVLTTFIYDFRLSEAILSCQVTMAVSQDESLCLFMSMFRKIFDIHIADNFV
jgi:hypothetical protein